MSVAVACWPAGSPPIPQSTVPDSFVQAPSGPDPETNVTSGGSGATSRTPFAPDGPLFVIEIVHVRLLVAATGFGDLVAATERFADVLTGVTIRAELFK